MCQQVSNGLGAGSPRVKFNDRGQDMTFSHKLMLSAAVVAIFGATMVAGGAAQAQTAEFKTKQAGDVVIRARVLRWCLMKIPMTIISAVAMAN